MVRRLTVFAAVAVVVAATAAAGLWFVPFVAGVAAGLLSRPSGISRSGPTGS